MAALEASSFPSVFGRVAERNRRLATPLLIQEGWTRHQEEVAKPPLTERTGWSKREPLRRNASETLQAIPTTPSAPLRWLRVFNLDGASTPSVSGGEFGNRPFQGGVAAPQ